MKAARSDSRLPAKLANFTRTARAGEAFGRRAETGDQVPPVHGWAPLADQAEVGIDLRNPPETSWNMYAHLPLENADTVSLVCALLERFPEIASLRALPADGTVRLTFAVKGRLDKAAQVALAEAVADHVGGFLMLSKVEPQTLKLECEIDRALAFVHVTRDLDSFTKDELEMLVALFAQRFGEALVRNPAADEAADADPAINDEIAAYAIEALRDPTQSKSLVGFREEKRVLVYFLKTRKKVKGARR
jgi:hypothetical protein